MSELQEIQEFLTDWIEKRLRQVSDESGHKLTKNETASIVLSIANEYVSTLITSINDSVDQEDESPEGMFTLVSILRILTLHSQWSLKVVKLETGPEIRESFLGVLTAMTIPDPVESLVADFVTSSVRDYARVRLQAIRNIVEANTYDDDLESDFIKSNVRLSNINTH